jgi:L-2-hydroxyglutarate oxidase LhgO
MKGVRVTDAGIVCASKNGAEELIKADTVICSIGQQSLYAEAKQLLDAAPEVFR